MKEIEVKLLCMCDNAFFSNVSNESNLNLIGVFDSIVASSFPVRHPKFSVVLRITGELTRHKATLEIEDPIGKTIIKEIIQPIQPITDISTYIITITNCRFKIEGIYKVLFKLNGKIVDKERGCQELVLEKTPPFKPRI